MGDMFGWITNGIAAGGMPGFANLLGEDERWDLVRRDNQNPALSDNQPYTSW